MKKYITILLALVMICSMAMGLQAKSAEGEKSFQPVLLNGTEVEINSYLIEERNYFKLRDLAALFAETGARFNVLWNAEHKQVEIVNGEAYEKQEGDLTPLAEGKVTGEVAEQTILVNGEERIVETALIAQNNYVKLRDVAEFLNFDVDYDPETKAIVLTFVETEEEDGPVDTEEKVEEKEEQEATEENDLTKGVHNDVAYDWFMDQGNTGKYSDGNCGPTSVAMVMKWLDQTSEATGESVRNWEVNGGDWWNTDIIASYFDEKKVTYEVQAFTDEAQIQKALEEGKIALLCMEMKAVSTSKYPRKDRTERFYGFDGGHFLIVKGYEMIDGKLYFEVYDPNNWGMKYKDTKEPLGKDRLYLASEVAKGIKDWWGHIFIISPNK
ncbi:MAG: stalk domain-containing protein [Tissierellia bacterium]|nr:stalk domain-containing protein [Tissierellia bacterium]